MQEEINSQSSLVKSFDINIMYYEVKKNKMRYIIIFIFLVLSLLSQAQTENCWSSFRGDAQLTGKSTVELPNQLKLKWTFSTEDAIKSSPVICDDKLFIGSNDGNLYALNLEGKLLWKYNAGTSIEAAPLLVDDKVIFGSLDGMVHALNQKDGTVVWKYETEGQISGAASWVWSSDKKSKYIIFGSYDFYLHAVDAKTGKVAWKYESDNFINGAPAIYQGMAIFGGCDGVLHQVNTQTGIEKSFIDVGTYIASSAAVDKGKAYFGNYDGVFYGADLNQKKVVWTDSVGPILGSPALSNEFVLIGTQDKSVYCYNKQSGERQWRFKTLKKVESSPVIVKNKVIVGSVDGRLYMLDLKSGEKIWSYEIGAALVGSPAIIKNSIAIGGMDGVIYFFGE